MSANGEVFVIFESNIASKLKSGDVSDVQSAGVDALIAQRRAVMDGRP